MSLEAIDIAIGYGISSASQRILVKGFNMSLSSGQLLAVIGPNGAGKSSLLRVLSGLQAPLSGSVTWNGCPLSKIPLRERPRIASVLFGEFARVDGFSVRDLVALGRQPFTGFLGKLRRNDESAIKAALEKAQIAHLASKQLMVLSDGELQKAMLAKMIAQDASILVLDEPTTHLDLPSAIDFIRLLKVSAKDGNKSIVFSSHDLALAFKLADQILILDGKGSWAIDKPTAIADHSMLRSFLRTKATYMENGNLIVDFNQE